MGLDDARQAIVAEHDLGVGHAGAHAQSRQRVAHQLSDELAGRLRQQGRGHVPHLDAVGRQRVLLDDRHRHVDPALGERLDAVLPAGQELLDDDRGGLGPLCRTGPAPSVMHVFGACDDGDAGAARPAGRFDHDRPAVRLAEVDHLTGRVHEPVRGLVDAGLGEPFPHGRLVMHERHRFGRVPRQSQRLRHVRGLVLVLLAEGGHRAEAVQVVESARERHPVRVRRGGAEPVDSGNGSGLVDTLDHSQPAQEGRLCAEGPQACRDIPPASDNEDVRGRRRGGRVHHE